MIALAGEKPARPRLSDADLRYLVETGQASLGPNGELPVIFLMSDEQAAIIKRVLGKEQSR